MDALLANFGEVMRVLLPVFLVAGIGFAWAKSGRVYPTKELTAFVTLVGTPALLFAKLLETETPFLGLLGYMGQVFAVIATVTLASYLILPLFGGDRRALTAAFSFPNVGNVGLPICIFAFGAAGGTPYALVYFAVSAMLMHSIGRWAHRGETNLMIILQSPVLWTMLVTFGLIYLRERTGFDLKGTWVWNAADLIGGMVIPAVLVSLGVALSQLRITDGPRNIALSATRFGLGLIIVLAFVWGFGMDGVAAKVFILQTLMPIAVLNYMFAAMYDNQVKETAGLVMVSNLMGVVTLPILLWFLI